MTESEAYVAFNMTEHVGAKRVAELAAAAGSVAAAWEAYAHKVSRTGGEVDFRGEFKKAARYGVRILTPADEDYPPQLLAAPGHPLALYVKGDAKVLALPSVAVVGTRRPTQYGLDQARAFGRELAEAGWCVVSGLALGIDAEAHRGALDAGGATVGVTGSGLDMFYPEQNRALARQIVESGGAVASEFPFGRPPDQQTFPQRNHVVAALVRGVVAVEAPVKSGTLITAAVAADLGRTVMAVPGRVDSRSSAGCLSLIRDGATLVRSALDVDESLRELIPSRGAAPRPRGNPRRPVGEDDPGSGAPRPKFTMEEALVMKHIAAEGVSMDDLVAATGFGAAKIGTLCMSLRVKGRIRFLPGNRVALPRGN